MQSNSKSIILELHVTRHGETQHNIQRIMCGQKPGKLTERGVEQALKLGQHFSNVKDFNKIYVSDLGRTIETFQNMKKSASQLSKVQTEYLSLLRERSVGSKTGQPLKLFDTEAAKSKLDIRDFKFQDGQSWNDLNTRVHKFLQYIVSKHLPTQVSKADIRKKILVVCHGGVIMQFHNACRVIRSKGKQKAKLDNSAVNCSVHVFELTYPLGVKQFSEDLMNMKCTVNNYADHMKA